MSRIMVVIIMSILLSGCAQQRVIDDLALINAMGYDVSDDEEDPLKVTATFPMITKEGKYDRKTLVVTGKSSKSAREKLKFGTNLQIESGQLRVALYGSELARKGLSPYLDTFVRDPSIGSRLMLALAKEEASEILTIDIEDEGQNAFFLEQFITKLHRESRKTHYNVYHFFRDLYDDGIDVILPAFKVSGSNIKYDGVGLFRHDKLIKIMNPLESHILFLLRDEIKHGDLYMQLDLVEDEKSILMLSFIQTQHDIDVTSISDGKINIQLEIEVIGDVIEYTGSADLSDPKILKKAEKLVSEYINKRGMELIKKLQEERVDPIGFGRYVRNKMSYDRWSKLEWHDVYKDSNIELKSSVKFASEGKWK